MQKKIIEDIKEKYHINITADINTRDNNGQTALMLAAYKGDYENTKKLLKNSATVNLQCKQGNSAIIFATMKRHASIVKLLMQYHADPYLKHNEEYHADDIAKIFSYSEIQDIISNHIKNIKTTSYANAIEEMTPRSYLVEPIDRESSADIPEAKACYNSYSVATLASEPVKLRLGPK